MGYTHYWYRPLHLDKAAFLRFAEDARLIVDAVEKSGVALGGWDGTRRPRITGESVIFNGAKGSDYETFQVDRKYQGRDLYPDEALKFGFCKTGQRPYDLAVTACLLAFKIRFGDAVKVSSDGEEADWLPAVGLVAQVIGHEGKWAFDGEAGVRAA